MTITAKEIRSLADIQTIERTPLAQRDLPKSTYELIGRSAQRAPDATALTFLLQGSDDEQPFTLSYAELFAKITQTANALHRLGLAKNQAVSFLLPNLPHTHYSIWGGEAAGIVNAINPLLDAEHILELIKASKSEILVTLAPFPGTELWGKVAAMRDQLSHLKAIIVVDLANFLPEPQQTAIKAMRGPLPEGVLEFDALIAQCPADHLESQRVFHPDDIASYFHTGGTTGTPKLAPHSHHNEVVMAYSMSLITGFDQSDTALCGLPLFHVNAVIVTGLTPFLTCSQVLLATPQGYRTPALLKNFWKIIERHKVSFFSGVPTIYAALLEVPSQDHDLSSLKYALCGAAPMPVELIRQFEQRTGVRLIEGYGLTEGTCGSCASPAGGELRPGSIGLRMPYCEVVIKIIDAEGQFIRDAVTDEVGQLCIRGPSVFKGYLKESNNQDIWLDGDWFNTGDLGRQDADGYFWLTGRSKDLIIRGGHNIDPQMIEEAMYQHPAVAVAAAVGKPDERVGELPAVYIQLKPGHSASNADLLQHAQHTIHERAAIPKDIWLLEHIPVTAVGKIFKPQLRLDAMRRVLLERLADLAEEVQIEVSADATYGMFAEIKLQHPSLNWQANAKQRLDLFKLRYSLVSAQ
ncbi:acyl-CoA synthetase [Denitrificimonas caeni]|uniref:acyl-CoA synthetase n=1 Tax=Denitrificimonas caeni TaxID=521720 RepID=UPI00196549C9|nr:acyl-CoA synthetase [Denitrificimonas caeni]